MFHLRVKAFMEQTMNKDLERYFHSKNANQMPTKVQAHPEPIGFPRIQA